MLVVTRMWNSVCAVASHAARTRARALVRGAARRVRAAAREPAAARRHAGGARGRDLGRVPDDVPARRAERAARARADRRRAARTAAAGDAAHQARHRQAGGRGRERGRRELRWRRLRRGHGPAATAARHAGAADLGGHDQRAVARRAAALRPECGSRRADGPGLGLRARAQRAAARGRGHGRRSRRSSARRCGSSPARSARCCRPARAGSR